jgi:hypothetical protein
MAEIACVSCASSAATGTQAAATDTADAAAAAATSLATTAAATPAATTPTASLQILSSQLERWHGSMVSVAWRTRGYVASEDDAISLRHAETGAEVCSAPVHGAWRPPAQPVGIAGETELLVYFEDQDEEAAALHTGLYYRLSFERGGQAVIGHSEAFQWVDPAVVAAGQSGDSDDSADDDGDSDNTDDDDDDDDDDDTDDNDADDTDDDDDDAAAAYAPLTHAATHPAAATAGGAVSAGGELRVGSAVQVTSDRSMLLMALQAIGWPIYGREDSLGQLAIVKSVTHSSTQDRVAILEMCNGRNADVLAMPKAALSEVADERLGEQRSPRSTDKNARWMLN